MGDDSMDIKSAVQSTHEQAFASWINFLNQMRIKELLEKLNQQDNNLKNTMEELSKLKLFLAEEIVNRNRGGAKGMHGFIGEAIQVYFKNANNLIDGLEKEYCLCNNNGPIDYFYNSTPIQQKCVQKNLGIDAMREHINKYPYFIEQDGVYQIPKDFYEKLKSIVSLTQEEAGKLPKESYKIFKEFQSFSKETGITLDDIETMEVNYSDIQKGTYEQTIKNKEKQIKQRDKENRYNAYQKSKPSLKQGTQIALVGAGTAGGLALCMSIAKKHKQGKRLSEYTEDDWKDIGKDTGLGTLKGGIRGASIYTLSNFTATPANVASALVTATYGVISQSIKLTQGKISKEDFIINSEACCLDAGISAISAIMGEILIPVPVLGAVIGNSVGNFIYGITQKYCSEKAQKCVIAYQSEVNELNKILDSKYHYFVEYINREFEKYHSVFELAFDKNINIAFENSISLARMSNVEESKILKTVTDIDDYFMS